MARGCIVKRCPICRKKGGSTPDHECSPHHVTYNIVYPFNRRQKWEVGGRTKKQAERLLAQRMAELHSGAYREPKKVYLEDFAKTWVANHVSSASESVLRGYSDHLRLHIGPALGGCLLNAITREQVDTFLTGLLKKRSRNAGKDNKTLSPSTINKIRGTLNMIMEYARQLRYVYENPVKDVKKFKVDAEEMDFLQPSEIVLLLKHASEPFKTLFRTAIFTGMRKGELLALQWGDIDWNRNLILVRRALHWRSLKETPQGEQRWYIGTTKTKNSIRSIMLSPMLKKALEIHRIMAPVSPQDFIFCNANGKPMDPDHIVSREFHPTLAMAGIRRIRFHDLRHTFATLLIAQGENIKFIQRQMGHASIQTTMDRYGHLFNEQSSCSGSKLDGQVFGCETNEVQRDIAFSEGIGISQHLPEVVPVQDTDEQQITGATYEQPAHV